MQRFPEFLVSVIVLGVSFSTLAQSTNHGLGKVPTEEDMQEWATPISPTGNGLPPGRGTAREGAEIYTQSCVFCHGPNGTNGPYPGLKGTPLVPYPTSIWDYINRAMPRSLTNPGAQERQLSVDEVYSLTAYMLHLNGLIEEDEVMDAESLPKVKMPISLMLD